MTGKLSVKVEVCGLCEDRFAVATYITLPVCEGCHAGLKGAETDCKGLERLTAAAPNPWDVRESGSP